MVDCGCGFSSGRKRLSVLALSSRFDGHAISKVAAAPNQPFQYSLCRVVLMVNATGLGDTRPTALSVLALSSRFDGLNRFCG